MQETQNFCVWNFPLLNIKCVAVRSWDECASDCFVPEKSPSSQVKLDYCRLQWFCPLHPTWRGLPSWGDLTNLMNPMNLFPSSSFIFLHPFIGPPFKVPKIITTITMTTPPWLSRALSLPSENSPWSPQPIVSMYLPYVQPTERSRRAAGRGTPPLDVACDKDDRSFFQELGSWMVFLGASSRVPIQRSLRIQTHS